MNTDKVEVTLQISNKSGVLASMLMIGKKFGLIIVKNKIEKIDENMSRLIILFEGNLSCSKDDLFYNLDNHPAVHSVKIIFLEHTDTPSDSSIKTKLDSHLSTSSNSTIKLMAHDLITPDSLHIAEKILMETLGPVAPMLIKSATEKTKHIGDLYLLLSDQLEGEERKRFLSLVSGLNLDQM